MVTSQQPVNARDMQLFYAPRRTLDRLKQVQKWAADTQAARDPTDYEFDTWRAQRQYDRKHGACLQVFDAVPHLIALKNTVQQQQHLDQRTDEVQVFGHVTPGDAGMIDATRCQDQIIRVVRDQNALFCRGESQLLRVKHSATAGFLHRQDIDAVLSQPAGHGAVNVLV